MTKRILIITNSLSRTGAPLSLLHVFKEINKRHSDKYIFDVLALGDGPLKGAFRQLSRKVYVSPLPNNSVADRLVRRIARLFRLEHHFSLKTLAILVLLRMKNYDLIYVNSIDSAKVGLQLISKKSKKPKSILHLHEMKYVVKNLFPDISLRAGSFDLVIAASEAVKSNFLELVGDNMLETKVIYEASELNNKIERIIKKIDITRTIHIGAAGQVSWRKGYDLFIQFALILKKSRPNCDFKFTWVGSLNEQTNAQIDYELEKSGLTSSVSFLGQLDDVSEVFNSFDIFVLPSREDPFPLVCIEAGQIGIPILSFENATGITEAFKAGEALAVPYLDVNALVEKAIMLIDDPGLYANSRRTSELAFNKYLPQVIYPEVLEAIENTLLDDKIY